mgnify:FL=1|tara:strand:- start:504 stop:965 length:462 start_codon:yes stop_codon:yes gene_type:complete
MSNTLNTISHTYNIYDFDSDVDFTLMNNRLFCTFTTLNDLDNLIEELSNRYIIMYDKMFVLYIKSNDEYVVTYNVDQANISNIPESTILVHRKKESNTLYTINALNELIKKLNNGVVDTKFPINWQHYRNCILLTQHNEIKQLNTKIHKIVEL